MSISLADALHKIVEHVHWREEKDYLEVHRAIEEHLSEETPAQQTTGDESK